MQVVMVARSIPTPPDGPTPAIFTHCARDALNALPDLLPKVAVEICRDEDGNESASVKPADPSDWLLVRPHDLPEKCIVSDLEGDALGIFDAAHLTTALYRFATAREGLGASLEVRGEALAHVGFPAP